MSLYPTNIPFLPEGSSLVLFYFGMCMYIGQPIILKMDDFYFILFVLPLIVKFLMEMCPLLFCHNLPVNVIYQISVSWSCSTNSVFLRRDTRGYWSFSCVLRYGNWCCNSRGDWDSSNRCFLMVIASRRIGPINQIINECPSSQCWISSMALTTCNVSILWGSGIYRNVMLYPSRIHATQNM